MITTTISAGDWNTAGNWDNGVPTVDDDAVVDHNMDIDGTGATFSTLDNNATITFSAMADVVIKDAGSIDNAGGTINASNQDITFKAATGTTKWTWIIDSGTWTDGTGEHHFENGIITISNNYTLFNSGTYFFDEDMQVGSSVASKYFRQGVPITFAAGKTFTFGDGTNSGFYFDIYRTDVTASGSSGNEITFDGNSNTAFFKVTYNNSGNTAIFQYVNSVDMERGFSINYVNTSDADSFTMENCTSSTATTFGFYFLGTTGAITLSNCDAYSCDKGFYLSGTASSSTFTYNDCNSYSNTQTGFENDNSGQDIVLNRCKGYGNSTVGVDNINGGIFTANSSLFYENTSDNLYFGNNDGCSITNVTLSDPGAAYSNLRVDLDTVGYVFTVKNCIMNAGKYGINSVGTSEDPVVTYSDVYGGTTANYNGMTDPTGSDGNISADPKFKDAAADDYDIEGNSPCVNTGTSTSAPATDIDNVAWPNANPEMGCYGELAISGYANDVNGVAGASLGEVNTVAAADINKVNQV